jgi:hypothetical protein
MRRTYVRRSSEAIAATRQLTSFCDAIKYSISDKHITTSDRGSNQRIFLPRRVVQTKYSIKITFHDRMGLREGGIIAAHCRGTPDKAVSGDPLPGTAQQSSTKGEME